MTGLFDLSVDQLEKLQAEAPTFWAKLDDDVRTYLEDIIAANESAEDLKDTLNESLTGITFDSVFDNFLDSLYDMESSAEDISDDMADYLRKSLIKSFAVENYKGKMQEWYEKWAEAMKDGQITSEEQKSLDDLKNSIITGATESAKLINDQFEYLKDDPSQSPTSRGFGTEMTHEDAGELSGRFTALQMAGEEIKGEVIKQTDILSSICGKMSLLNATNENLRGLSGANISDIAGQTRGILANSYQSQISMAFPTDSIKVLADKMSSMERIVDEIRTVQVSGLLESQTVAENTTILAKNSPKVLSGVDEIKRDVKNAI